MGIFYKPNYLVKPIDASTDRFCSFEYSAITIKQFAGAILILCIYRKQEISVHQFLAELSIVVDELQCKGKLLIVGDFNIWADQEHRSDAVGISTLM